MGTRRTFLKALSSSGPAVWFAGDHLRAFQAGSRADWKQQVGIELNTVRDLMTTPERYEETLTRLAGIGFKEIESSVGFNDMQPKAFRPMLDRHGLRMVSTHTGSGCGT